MLMYRGIMELVGHVPLVTIFAIGFIYYRKVLIFFLQDSLPILPPGCSSEEPDKVQDFMVKAKAALVSVGIVRDTVVGNLTVFGITCESYFKFINGTYDILVYLCRVVTSNIMFDTPFCFAAVVLKLFPFWYRECKRQF